MTGKYLPTFTGKDVLSALWQREDGLARLREQLGTLHGARHVFLFQSARSALHALLCALGGDGKVVLPAYNCIAVPEAVEWAGWLPVLADIAPGDINMTRETLAAALPPDARAIILTHQFGLPSEVEPILELCRQRNLFVIEDAAPALGARYRSRLVGMFGDAAVLSFHLTKVVNAGRGGALLTNNDQVAEKVATLQARQADATGSGADFAKALAWWAATRPGSYGVLRRVRSWIKSDPLYEVAAPSPTPPADSFSACSNYVAKLVSRQLDSLPANVARRRALASIYLQELSGCVGIQLPKLTEEMEPAWIQFPIFVERKEACYQYLLRQGVDLNWTFRYSCGVSYQVQNAPNSEKAARTVLGLPTYPGLPVSEAQRICKLLRNFTRSG